MIIKELEAQRQIDSILIICPKPLVAEEKWNREMERFDEHFVSVDKQSLLRIMDQNNRDSQWPIHSKKLVIPYSIMDEQLYEGKDDTIVAHTSLMQLDPPTAAWKRKKHSTINVYDISVNTLMLLLC